MPKKSPAPKTVASLKHEEATRKNIPTAEYESVLEDEAKTPIRVAYARRNRDLDPQLVWRGKDEQDRSDLVVAAPPLYIQEKVHPKALIDDLLRDTRERAHEAGEFMADLFADFNGIPQGADKTEFYQHDQNWSNRMILGDSLQVMASLAEREGLRGRVQCVYLDPPYGIKFNSNFQWSTTSRDVKDGSASHITREPEQVRAYRDTWRDGVHSYLTYLRDRLTLARDLLTESGSIFVQIGDQNVHMVRSLMDEVFGTENFCSQISFRTTGGQSNSLLASSFDILLWYGRRRDQIKYRTPYVEKPSGADGWGQYVLIEESARIDTPFMMTAAQKSGYEAVPPGSRVLAHDTLYSSGAPSDPAECDISFRGRTFRCPSNTHWKPGGRGRGMDRLAKANRLLALGNTLRYKRYWHDFPVRDLDNFWIDTSRSGFGDKKQYIVETSTRVVQRCLLMTTDVGDLVLDPTCGSGTTATIAEQWGRRWITVDTSRVALALARARVMGARYPFFLLADSREGQLKEAEITGKVPSSKPVYGNVGHGFVYERVPHVTLKSIANDAEIDVVWNKWQATLEPLCASLNAVLGRGWHEWDIPRDADTAWPETARRLHAELWQNRIERQAEIDVSIAAKAEFEYLYDKPYEDKKTVRVAGPFTVESLSPHRVLAVGPDDELLDPLDNVRASGGTDQSFPQMILENLKRAGVQQAHKDDKITFTALAPWPGTLVCAEGRYLEGDGSGAERRAAIFIGPEFGTVTRPDLVAAAREAADAGFDALVACAFNYEAHATDFNKLGRIAVLKARMNADLHMADDLKNTGKGNLFVIFGEPDITLIREPQDKLRVKINGVDVFHPNSGEVRSDGADGIACWFIDTDYNEESFFVRHAYFLGANDPYGALKTTLKAEIDADAWSTLNNDTSRAFPKPSSGRIAVKVINHLGDEVMKVFKVE